MASSRTWRYRVFTSFHGPDVRKTFLSHLRKQFSYNGVTMFDDQGIERSQIIAPALPQAIRESRISIVVLSKNYASSSWCLDELVEIFKCKEEIGQIVMTVFYGVAPSDVGKQTGEFGSNFKKTCRRKTKEEKQKWSQALTDVANIPGEQFVYWDDESNMIEKIARDISDKLNSTTISRDFEDMVGLEAHLEKMQSLLNLDYEDEVMMVGICGPAGIGKTTIARALHSQLSSSFHLTCFMENIRGSYHSGLDEHGLQLRLQEQLLSKILTQNDIRIPHLGAIKETLYNKQVLIILDDVDDLQQLETLANGPHWFGPGSRIIATTEDHKLLEQHGINNIYHVGFPTEEEARNIICRYAFRHSSIPYGFEKLIKRVTKLCNNLPLGLRVMGSSLGGKKENEWKVLLHRLENRLSQDIEEVLEVGFDSLQKDDQLLFLNIAFNYNYKGSDYVTSMLAGSNIDVRLGLKTLAYKSLIEISTEGNIVMNKLLQQMGREAVKKLRPEERFLIHAAEFPNVLENDSGSTSVPGKSLIQISSIEGKQVNRGAVKRKGLKEKFLIHADEYDVLEDDSGSTSVPGKSLIHISTGGKQVGREAVKRKRLEEQVLSHADAFPDVLEKDTGSASVTSKSLIQKQASRRAVKRQRLEEQVLNHADDICVVVENDSGSTISIEGTQVGREVVQIQEQSLSNKPIGKSKSWCFTRTAILVVINLLLEIASVVADQLSSIHNPWFARISLVMSIISVALSILDLYLKIRDHKASFRCKWPIPWFYYPLSGNNIILGSLIDTVLLFCVVGQLIVSLINCIFIETREDGPIKVSVWPLFFAIGKVGSEFMEKPTKSEDNSCKKNVKVDIPNE